jgi:hypothetical protein
VQHAADSLSEELKESEGILTKQLKISKERLMAELHKCQAHYRRSS